MANELETGSVDTIEDIIDLFDKEASPEEKEEEVIELDKNKEEDPGEEEEEEEKDEKEEEIKLETEEETALDEENSFDPFNKKKFLKEFPDAFKKFPGLEKGYYASRAYREVFPTVKDAKEAQEKIEVFDSHVQNLDKGDARELFKDLKERSPESFSKFVDNYLINLREVDPKAHTHILSGLIGDTIITVARDAEREEDEDLFKAAQLFKKYWFGKDDITPTRPFNPKNPEVEKVDEERNKFNQEKLNHHQGEVNQKFDSLLSSTIKKHIDPKDQMSPYVKKTAINEVLSLVKKTLEQDQSYKSTIQKMWKKAEESQYSIDSKSKIHNAQVSKAQAILSSIIRKVRSEALSGVSAKNGSGRERETQRTLPRSTSSSPRKAPSGDLKNKSTLDILNDGD